MHMNNLQSYPTFYKTRPIHFESDGKKKITDNVSTNFVTFKQVKNTTSIFLPEMLSNKTIVFSSAQITIHRLDMSSTSPNQVTTSLKIRIKIFKIFIVFMVSLQPT